MASHEIEIKSLLGSKVRAEELRTNLKKFDPNSKLISKHSQLNHYFIGSDIKKLEQSMKQHLSVGDAQKFSEIIVKGKDFSVRTRTDTKTLLVVKASLDSGTSHNTVSRMEFEAEVPMSIDELDKTLLSAGFAYQAKWSREREEYAYKNAHVCLDKNAGYGYLAEFEKVVEEGVDIDAVKAELKQMMDEVGVEELPQARLERMFAYYNIHWPEYYGTDNIFTIQ